jgi:hypothetical protein
MTRPSRFERDSTKAPLWLPIVGVLLFVAIALVAVLRPDARPPARRPGAGPPASQVRPPSEP